MFTESGFMFRIDCEHRSIAGESKISTDRVSASIDEISAAAIVRAPIRFRPIDTKLFRNFFIGYFVHSNEPFRIVEI